MEKSLIIMKSDSIQFVEKKKKKWYLFAKL